MLIRAVDVRNQIISRLRDHNHRADQTRELHRSLALVQGVLAYAALDLGQADGAATHAALGWKLAERNDDNELRVWVRGTQSLIARFELRLPARPSGTSRTASDTRRRAPADCGCSPASPNAAPTSATPPARTTPSTRPSENASNYGPPTPPPVCSRSPRPNSTTTPAAACMWLPDRGRLPAEPSRRQRSPIALWEREPPDSRSLDDEALAHIYEATAWVHLGDLDEAARAVAPILNLPETARSPGSPNGSAASRTSSTAASTRSPTRPANCGTGCARLLREWLIPEDPDASAV